MKTLRELRSVFCAMAFLFLTACGDNSSSSSENTSEVVVPEENHPDYATLVFRDENTGYLKIVHYKDSLYTVSFEDEMVEDLVKTNDCYHPEISPDGQWVAYSTTFESSGAISQIFVQQIGAEENPIGLDVPSAAVPRWIVLANGDTCIYYIDDTSLNENDYWNTLGTWIVPFMDGAFGTPRKLFDGTFNGGMSENLTYAVGAAGLLMSRYLNYENDSLVSYVDSVWYDREQTCNASLAKDGSKRTLFLDMAGRQGLDFVGSKYRPHQQILVIDSLGHLIQSVPSPKNTAYDHTEWVGHKNLVVASLQDVDLLHSKLVLVDMDDSSVVNLVTGGELWHPCLRINK